MARVFIGLGSNLGDRDGNLRRAREAMIASGQLRIIRESGILETDPLEFTAQPRFLNQVVAAETTLGPHALLSLLKTIERELGRTPGIPKGPRLIDLDILLYDDLVLQAPDLTIPHAAVTRRPFLIEHLVELEPDCADPVTGRPYRELLPRG